MAFKFLKKEKNIPPDVGQEDINSEENKKNKDSIDEEDIVSDESNEPEDKDDDVKLEEVENEGANTAEESPEKKIDMVSISNERFDLEFQKINARLGFFNELMKGHVERMSMLNQQLGEVRSMALTNERAIGKITVDAAKAIDVVKEVKPENIRLDYRKIEARVLELNEKLASNKEFMDTVMNELKDLRKTTGTFLKTEELLKINEDLKKDLVETQKLATRTKLEADKTEQLFAEMRLAMAENQKVNEKINNLDAIYSEIQKGIEKLKIDYSNIVRTKDFNDFKKTIENKVILVNKGMDEINGMMNEQQRLTEVVETILGIVQQNKEDISDIAITIGDDHIKRVSDYDNKLMSILKILDSLAEQISKIKKEIGTNDGGKAVFVRHTRNKPIIKNKLNLKHIDIHPEVSKNLISDKPEVPQVIKDIQEAEKKDPINKIASSLGKMVNRIKGSFKGDNFKK